jgi:hypothetical protein
LSALQLLLQDLDEVLSQDIPRLMEQLPTSDVRTKAEREMAALLHTPSPLQFDDMAPPPQQGPAGASPLSTGNGNAYTSRVIVVRGRIYGVLIAASTQYCVTSQHSIDDVAVLQVTAVIVADRQCTVTDQ